MPKSISAQFAFLKAGMNFNTANVKDINTGERLSSGVNAGLNDFSAGAGLGGKIKDKVYIQLGLDWMVKGYRNKFSEDPWDRNSYWNIYKDFENHKVRTRLHYIGLPITASYYINIKDLKFYVQGGVFTSYGIFGTEAISGKYEGETRKESLGDVFLFSNNQGVANIGLVGKERGDRGLILGFGIEVDEFQFGLQYHRSTKNIARNDYDLRNRTLSLCITLNLDLKSI
jgi:hypothetical protein